MERRTFAGSHIQCADGSGEAAVTYSKRVRDVFLKCSKSQEVLSKLHTARLHPDSEESFPTGF